MNNTTMTNVSVFTAALRKGGLLIHARTFHSDDVFVGALCDLKCPGVKIVRDFKVPAGFTGVVADLGRIYDPERLMFDHHQDDAPDAPDGHRMCSFEQIVRYICSSTEQKAWLSIAEDLSRTDNGKAEYASGLALAVSAMNPTWEDSAPDAFDVAYSKAVIWAKDVLVTRLAYVESAERGESIVQAAIDTAEDRVVVLDRFVPFDDLVTGHPELVKAVVTPAIGGGYNVRIPNDAPGSFGLVGSFVPGWDAGFRSCTFVHANGFLAHCWELEDAIQMAHDVVVFKDEEASYLEKLQTEYDSAYKELDELWDLMWTTGHITTKAEEARIRELQLITEGLHNELKELRELEEEGPSI